ncbi:MAG TPA: sulfatase-like hydrolase/transferase [Solirubrobacteraceae bacterium]
MTTADRPNVILFVIDALRADEVEGYGAPAGASPTLGQLGRAGAAVGDVRTTASWTLPAHAAMFSGQLARGLGLGQAPGQVPQGAAPVIKSQRPRLIAEVLRQQGYDTRGLSTNGWSGKHCAFDSGFETFVDLVSSRQNDLGGGLRNRLRWDWEAMHARADDGTAAAEDLLAGWIGKSGARPFFWFMNLVECHSPYLPPKPYAARSPLTRARVADEAFRHLTFEAILLACLGKRQVPPGAIDRMRRMYRAALKYIDDWLSRLLERLDQASLLDDTLIIVCADHGENFGVGGLMGHGLSLDDRLLRVPLVVSGPGAQEFHGMRSLVEMPARIGRVSGVEDGPWPDGLPAGLAVAQWDPFQLGQERLAQLMRDWDLDEQEAARLTAPMTCAVSGQLKLVRGAQAEDEWLFDLEADPLELAPIRGEPEIATRAGSTLRALREAVNHPLVQATAEVSSQAEEVSADEMADIERRMRLMGYM